MASVSRIFEGYVPFITQHRLLMSAPTLYSGTPQSQPQCNMNTMHHWRYFLALEREYVDALRYVEPTSAQQGVYSFEFARLLLLLCSELDVVFKVACDKVDPACAADSIGKYFPCLDEKYNLASETVRVDRYSSQVIPFENWGPNSPPAWWTAGSKVKHRRHEYFHLATIGNALHALCGLFVGNLLLLHEQGMIDRVYEMPVLLGRDSEPGHLMLESSYAVSLR